MERFRVYCSSDVLKKALDTSRRYTSGKTVQMLLTIPTQHESGQRIADLVFFADGDEYSLATKVPCLVTAYEPGAVAPDPYRNYNYAFGFDLPIASLEPVILSNQYATIDYNGNELTIETDNFINKVEHSVLTDRDIIGNRMRESEKKHTYITTDLALPTDLIEKAKRFGKFTDPKRSKYESTHYESIHFEFTDNHYTIYATDGYRLVFTDYTIEIASDIPPNFRLTEQQITALHAIINQNNVETKLYFQPRMPFAEFATFKSGNHELTVINTWIGPTPDSFYYYMNQAKTAASNTPCCIVNKPLDLLQVLKNTRKLHYAKLSGDVEQNKLLIHCRSKYAEQKIDAVLNSNTVEVKDNFSQLFTLKYVREAFDVLNSKQPVYIANVYKQAYLFHDNKMFYILMGCNEGVPAYQGR